MIELCAMLAKKGEATMSKPNANFVDEITNYEEALEVVKDDGLALRYVPPEHKTTALCFAAVRQNGKALKYVPKELRDEVSFLHTLDLLEEVGKYVIEDEDDGEP